MRKIVVSLLTAAALTLSATAPVQASEMTDKAEKLSIKPHRIKGLLLGFGYELGEYSGQVKSSASSSRLLIFSGDKGKTEFTVSAPSLESPMTVTCAGGQSNFTFAWINFAREDLAYVCNFQGGPPDASLGVALRRGGKLAAKLYQPQRAGEIRFGGRTLRAMTQKIPGAMIVGGGQAMSYVITKDGEEIGGYTRGPFSATVYLPPKGSPDRDAAAVMAITLFAFPDPANSMGPS